MEQASGKAKGREQRVPHLVKYTKTDGQSGDYEVEDLHEAVAYVERLRNEEGVEGARIFRIEEVRFEYKPYFRVELGGSTAPQARASFTPMNEAPTTPIWAPPAETTAPAEETETPVAEEPATVAAVMSEAEPAEVAPLTDPWADAPPPPAPPSGDAEPATVANGRRGLFGR